MKRFTHSQRRFAYAVAGLAGFVDITGFLQLNGYFVSFMTGNTTLLARDLAGGVSRAAVPALLILGFVIGVTIGTLAGDRWAARRKPVVTALVAAMPGALIECRLGTRRVTRESSSLRGSFFEDSLGTSLITGLSFFVGTSPSACGRLKANR